MKANPFLITQNQQSPHVNLYRTKRNRILSFIQICVLFVAPLFTGGVQSVFAEGEATPVISFSQVSDIAIPATDTSGAIVSYTAPTASEYDETSGNTNNLPVACIPDTGTLFSMGSTSVTCTATSQIDSGITSSVSFTVAVADMNAPVITITGSSSETLTVGDIFVDQGATALDDVDGDVTSSITSSSTVDTAMIGSYAVTYAVSDIAGNMSSLVRSVEVVASSSDNQATSTVDIFSSVNGMGDITPNGTTTLNLGDSQTYTITPQDGYKIDKLVIDGQDTNATTSYTFASTTESHTITAFFSPISQGGGGGSQDVPPVGPTTASSSTHVINATSSVHDISVEWDMATGTLPVSGYSYIFDSSASSSPDAVIDTDGLFATSTLADGEWYFHVQAIDSNGNIGIVLSVGPYIIQTDSTSTDTTSPTTPVPTVVQTGSSTATLSWTTSTDDVAVVSYLYGFSTSSDTLPTTLVSGTTTSVDVTLEDGIWYASVQAVDAAGNASLVGTTTSLVVDTGRPVITLNGTSTVTLYLHDSYTEQGATAFDDIYGDITSSIQMLGSVDTDTVGDYTITYVVTDASGNIANPVVRTIHVIADTTSPTTPVPTVVQTGSSTATLSWTTSTDDVAVVSYLYGFSTSSDTLPTTLVSGTTTSVDVTLEDGIWYASVQAVDAAGNASLVGTTTSLVVDTGAPTAVTNISGSVPLSLPTDTHDITVTWSPSFDGISGIQGYSFVFDTNSSTTPDGIIDVATTSAAVTLPYGTYYFHVRSVDVLGNVSAVEHYGPFVLSETNITITDSTYNGTYYSFYSPTRQEGIDLGITGDTRISNSVISSSTVASSEIASSTVTDSEVVDSVISGASIVSSILRFLNGVNAVIQNNLVTSGTFILPTGNAYTVTTPVAVDEIANDKPQAGFSVSGYDYSLHFKDTSYDRDENEGVFNDRWTIFIDFGDGTTFSTTTSTLGLTIDHTYARSIQYNVLYRVTDIQGESSSVTQAITLAFPSPPSVYTIGGGGGWFSSDVWFKPENATTSPMVLEEKNLPATSTLQIVTKSKMGNVRNKVTSLRTKVMAVSNPTKHSSDLYANASTPKENGTDTVSAVAPGVTTKTSSNFFLKVLGKVKSFLGF